MIEYIISLLYVLLFFKVIITSRSRDLHFIKEDKKTAIKRRCFFISFFCLLFSSAFLVTKSFDIGVFSILLTLMGTLGVMIKAIRAKNKTDTWQSHFTSILFHILTLYPIIVFVFYYDDMISYNYLYTSILFCLTFMLFYVFAHPYIYEHAALIAEY